MINETKAYMNGIISQFFVLVSSFAILSNIVERPCCIEVHKIGLVGQGEKFQPRY